MGEREVTDANADRSREAVRDRRRDGTLDDLARSEGRVARIADELDVDVRNLGEAEEMTLYSTVVFLLIPT